MIVWSGAAPAAAAPLAGDNGTCKSLDTVGDADRDAPIDEEREGVTARDDDTARTLAALGVSDMGGVALGVVDTGGVALGDAPRESEAVGVALPVCVGVAVTELVPVGVEVSVAELVDEIGDVELDAVKDADAPGERGGVLDALAVDDALVVDEAVSEPEGVPVRVDVDVPVQLLVCDAVGV